MAAATAAATASATRGAGGGFWRAACDRRTENGKLNRGFFAGTLRTGDFLLAVDDDFFELRFAVVADVFVDGHARFLYMNVDYSNFGMAAPGRRKGFNAEVAEEIKRAQEIQDLDCAVRADRRAGLGCTGVAETSAEPADSPCATGLIARPGVAALGKIDAAVGVDGLAGDEAALCQENGDARDFVHRAQLT